MQSNSPLIGYRMFEFDGVIIEYLQNHRTDVLDALALYQNKFGANATQLLALPMILFIHVNRGRLILIAIILSHLINQVLKHIIQIPRPHQKIDMIHEIGISGYGFPSGDVQAMVLCTGLMAYLFRSKTLIAVAVVFVSFTIWARLYLGAHNLSQCLAGGLVGLGILKLIIKYLTNEQRHFQDIDFRIWITIVTALHVCLHIFSNSLFSFVLSNTLLSVIVIGKMSERSSLPNSVAFTRYSLPAYSITCMLCAIIFVLQIALVAGIIETLQQSSQGKEGSVVMYFGITIGIWLSNLWIVFGAPWLTHRLTQWNQSRASMR